uniref:Uncharacterized protein n=1 Tax=Timema douglasi TaxID=61478 RepID=A0A7R8VC84_TIMDO|nr:unnamed protein product [Timema douglasi]
MHYARVPRKHYTRGRRPASATECSKKSPSCLTDLPVTGRLSLESRIKLHSTEIQTSISPSSAAELNTTSALANYATEAGRRLLSVIVPRVLRKIRETVLGKTTFTTPDRDSNSGTDKQDPDEHDIQSPPLRMAPLLFPRRSHYTLAGKVLNVARARGKQSVAQCPSRRAGRSHGKYIRIISEGGRANRSLVRRPPPGAPGRDSDAGSSVQRVEDNLHMFVSGDYLYLHELSRRTPVVNSSMGSNAHFLIVVILSHVGKGVRFVSFTGGWKIGSRIPEVSCSSAVNHNGPFPREDGAWPGLWRVVHGRPTDVRHLNTREVTIDKLLFSLFLQGLLLSEFRRNIALGGSSTCNQGVRGRGLSRPEVTADRTTGGGGMAPNSGAGGALEAAHHWGVAPSSQAPPHSTIRRFFHKLRHAICKRLK